MFARITNRQRNRQTDRQTDRQRGRETSSQTDRLTGRERNRLTDRLTDRQNYNIILTVSNKHVSSDKKKADKNKRKPLIFFVIACTQFAF